MQRKENSQRAAFTLIEVVFVIVVLGIVVGIGAQIISQVYKGYIYERAGHKTGIKTELAANFIVNRLNYAIPGTEIAKQSGSGSYVAIYDVPSSGTANYDILEWYGYLVEALEYPNTPGWSGVADIWSAETNNTRLITPYSDLSKTNTIIGNLFTSKTISDSVVLFPDTFSVNNIGYDGTYSGDNNVTGYGSSASGKAYIQFNPKSNRRIKEHYMLSASAYALVPENYNTANHTYDLMFYYDYRPWQGESYANGKSSVLLKDVTVFRFKATPNAIRIKICQKSPISDMLNDTVATCKEKVVMR